MRTQDEAKRVTAAFRKLFATCPLPSANASPETAIAVFFEVCGDSLTDDIEYVARQFMIGAVPGHNPAFAPTAAEFAIELRKLDERRERIRLTHQAAQKQIADRDKPIPTEAQVAAVREMTALAVERLSGGDPLKLMEEQRSYWATVNAKFEQRHPIDVTDAGRAKRLGYSAGTPEDRDD